LGAAFFIVRSVAGLCAFHRENHLVFFVRKTCRVAVYLCGTHKSQIRINTMLKGIVTRVLAIFLLLYIGVPDAAAQSRAAKSIRAVMAAQQSAWNRGDLETFMAGYWKSDSLCFIGSRGLTYGWAQTLANYQKGYPNAEAMGQLTFTIVSVEQLSRKSAYVIGKWHLARKSGDVQGYYTLLWKKVKGRWYIVSDHSS
jgi:ketosteroid isomerase-like protein